MGLCIRVPEQWDPDVICGKEDVQDPGSKCHGYRFLLKLRKHSAVEMGRAVCLCVCVRIREKCLVKSVLLVKVKSGLTFKSFSMLIVCPISDSLTCL